MELSTMEVKEHKAYISQQKDSRQEAESTAGVLGAA